MGVDARGALRATENVLVLLAGIDVIPEVQKDSQTNGGGCVASARRCQGYTGKRITEEH